MYPPSASDFFADQQRLSVAATAASRRLWAQMGEDFDASWSVIGPRLTVLVASAQLNTAGRVTRYVPQVLDDLDIDAEAEGRLNSRAFFGIASDGRPMGSLLYSAVTRAKQSVGGGSPVGAALASGGAELDMLVQTQTADTARAALSIETAVRPKVTGYVRMLRAPSCSRCAILAGKFYKWNSGFLRHPRCDCVHIPATEAVAGDMTVDPRKAVEAGQVTGLTKTQQQAISDGADPAQVVNADRRVLVDGKYVSKTDGMLTAEGASRRGRAGKALDAPKGGIAQRLAPEGIYSIAGSREEAIELLRDYGYIT